MSCSMRRQAQSMIGRPVCAHHVDGTRHYGILHSVTSDGIYLNRQTGTYAAADAAKLSVQHLDGASHDKTDAEEAFFPFLFLPFLALAALSPWGWGYGGYGGYGGYWW